MGWAGGGGAIGLGRRMGEGGAGTQSKRRDGGLVWWLHGLKISGWGGGEEEEKVMRGGRGREEVKRRGEGEKEEKRNEENDWKKEGEI